MTMQLSDEQVETYRRDGVLPLGEVLDTEAVEAAREHLDQLRENEYIDNPSEGSGKDTFRRLEVSRVDPWFMSLVTRDSNRPRRGYSVHLQQAGLLGQSAEHSPLLAGEMPAEC